MPPSPLSPSPRPQGTQPHYQLGDLGLIPRPAQNIPSSVEKMKESATASGLGGLKKVLTKSVATQTISAPKVSLASWWSNFVNINFQSVSSHLIEKIICEMHSTTSYSACILDFQAMFFADQLLSRMPNHSQVLHDLNAVKEITRWCL